MHVCYLEVVPCPADLYAEPTVEFCPARAAHRHRRLYRRHCVVLPVVVFTDSRPSSIATMTFPAFANPILLWAIYAAPSVFLLLFLNRTVRAVGPVLLIFAFLVFLGWHTAVVALGTSPGMQAAR
jgi:hypothetical protein